MPSIVIKCALRNVVRTETPRVPDSNSGRKYPSPTPIELSQTVLGHTQHNTSALTLSLRRWVGVVNVCCPEKEIRQFMRQNSMALVNPKPYTLNAGWVCNSES